MNYRTYKIVSALYRYLLEEPCNENLDLSIFLDMGWPVSELKETVLLLRKLISTDELTQAHLRSLGFSHSLLEQTLPLLPEELVPWYSMADLEDAIDDSFDQSHPIIHALTKREYTLHRLHPDSMSVHMTNGPNSIHLEWVMMKYKNQMCGWVLMPKP